MTFLRLLFLAALAFDLYAGTVVFGNISCSYAGAAIASCISESSAGSDPVESAGPLYDSFTSSGAAEQLTDLQLVLSGDDTSSGAVQVGLYADNSGAPAATPLALGSLSDSALSGTPELYDLTLTANPLLNADTVYWIGLSGTTSAEWYYDSDASGIGVAGQFFANQAGVAPDSEGPYQMQITESPEPASALLIAAGAGFLALLRRRPA